MGKHSDTAAADSGSRVRHVFVVGLETGVSWTGGEGHGEPRGDTLEGEKPGKHSKMVSISFLSSAGLLFFRRSL